jgi:hypothetical protein
VTVALLDAWPGDEVVKPLAESPGPNATNAIASGVGVDVAICVGVKEVVCWLSGGGLLTGVPARH